MISDRIVDVVKAKYFAVLCDETTDSTVTRNSFTCAFASSTVLTTSTQFDNSRRIHIQFQTAVDLTGEGLAAKIVSILRAHIVWTCSTWWDRATTERHLAGCFSGCQKKVREVAAMATYVHCASHATWF